MPQHYQNARDHCPRVTARIISQPTFVADKRQLRLERYFTLHACVSSHGELELHSSVATSVFKAMGGDSPLKACA